LEANHTPIPQNLIHVSPLKAALNVKIYDTPARGFVKSFCVKGAGRLGHKGRMIYACNLVSLQKSVQSTFQEAIATIFYQPSRSNQTSPAAIPGCHLQARLKRERIIKRGRRGGGKSLKERERRKREELNYQGS
jgi:hypothetical protein